MLINERKSLSEKIKQYEIESEKRKLEDQVVQEQIQQMRSILEKSLR